MELMSKQEVVAEFKISERTLEMWVFAGKFPQAVRIGKRAFWTREALQRWKTLAFACQLKFKPR